MTDLLLQVGVSNLLVSLALAVVAWARFLTTVTPSPSIEALKTGLALLWLLGSVSVLTWSLVRIYRFNRLLGMASEEAPPELQHSAQGVAQRLGLARAPTIYTTPAHVSPMVWWIGGKVRIVIPEALPREMGASQLRWILAHELAHVRRRDHLVRWLEWLACVGFWWNPVAWWARRNLRIHEEVCCDALVLSCLNPEPHTYADSLLTAVEFLATPALRPPAMASEINGGGFLERRFNMILSNTSIRSTPRWLHALVLIFAVVLLPLGVAYAQGPDYDAVGRRLRQAVAAGELTGAQARTMLDALRQQGGAKNEADADAIALRKRLGAAVENGRITRQEARDIFDKRMAAREKAPKPQGGERKRITREDYARAAAEFRKAVAAGKISGEDARARLGAMREMMAEQGERAREERGGEGRDLRKEYTAFERRVKAGVKSGRITEEEAKRALEGFRLRLGEAAGGRREGSEETPGRGRRD